jgi:DNA-binding transcriptional LysR family regulator
MSTRRNLDLDTLRTLSAAHDLGGLAQAAEQLGRTPSAISLQMKRLQDELGTPLFRKRGRHLALTEAGDVALRYARRMLALNDELLDIMQGANLAGQIRIGCTQDFASILPPVMSHFASLYRRMQIELRIEGNAALADAAGTSQIDLAIVIGHEDRPNAQTIGRLDLVWIASADYRTVLRPAAPVWTACGPHCSAGSALPRAAQSTFPKAWWPPDRCTICRCRGACPLLCTAIRTLVALPSIAWHHCWRRRLEPNCNHCNHIPR